jgi:hypothetical protein
VVLLPALHRRAQPVAVLLADIVRGDAVRVVLRLLRVVLLGDDQRRLDDAVLHGLGERVVAHGPGEVHAVLVLGRRREVEPEGKALGQCAVDREQRLAPGEVIVVDVVRLVVHHHEVLERLHPLQHRALARGGEVLRRLLAEQRLDGVGGVHSSSRDS